VNWQVGALVALGLALAGGFGWYERARPDARIVALVATLAALAALGRVAFAAVPNVKPTTDIVLIAGYALGGGPGFAVGAIAALSSNFFFGQGPWTPWQMVGWGLTGVIGAGVARLPPRLRRRHGPVESIGRLPLAVVCCLVGFGFTALQDVGDWVTYSEHRWAQLAAYVGTGLGFDLVHALGCVAFALAIGPALARSVQRFARRLEVKWLPPAISAGPSGPGDAGAGGAGAGLGGAGAGSSAVALVVAAVLVAVAAPVAARAGAAPAGLARAGRRSADAASLAPAQAAARAVAYLVGAQNADGGFGAAPGQPSSQLFAGWVALGLASAGRNPATVSRGPGLPAYIRSRGPTDPGSLERTILALRASGLPARVGGRDLVAELERDIRPDGSVARQVNWTAFAILALRAAGVAPPASAVRWLVSQQDRDGGFSFAPAGGSSDADDTGAALEALAGDPGARGVRARAIAYLRLIQDRDGGFPSQPGSGSNAQSTAWVVQGLIAAGVAPASLRRGGGPSPLEYLTSMVQANGSVDYARGQSQTPVWVTAEALMALEGRPLPVVGMSVHPSGARARQHPPTRSVSARRTRRTGRSGGSASDRVQRGRRAAAGSKRVQARPSRDRRPPARRTVAPSSRTASPPPGPLTARVLLVAIGVAEALALAPAGLG